MVETGGRIVVRWREPRHYAGPVSPFSKGGIALGLVMALFFVFAASWNMAAYTFWSILAYGLTFTLLLMGIAVRAWLLLGVDVWVWVPFVASAYILAWLVPALWPKISCILWREQVAPQTKVGRALFAIALCLAPGVGVMGALLGMFSSRRGELSRAYLVMALLFSAVAIVISFAFSYQLWPHRPWAQDRPARKAGA